MTIIDNTLDYYYLGSLEAAAGFVFAASDPGTSRLSATNRSQSQPLPKPTA